MQIPYQTSKEKKTGVSVKEEAEMNLSKTETVLLSKSRVAERFGERGKELTKHGWTPVPNPLLRNWRLLDGIVRTDVLILLTLMLYVEKDGNPRQVSVSKLLVQLDLKSERHLRRRLRHLHNEGYIKIIETTGQRNKYDLSPLYNKLIDAQKKYFDQKKYSESCVQRDALSADTEKLPY
jgi:hypothetical protein